MSNLELRTKSVDDSITIIEERGPLIAIEYQPGNGSRYCLVITKLDPLGDEFLQSIGRQGKTWVLTWLAGSKGKSMTFGDGLLHFNYVQEKLDCSRSDAIVIAEIAGQLTKNDYVSCEQFA